MHGHGISIWFFIGLSLLVNGILIVGAGIWELIHPPAHPTIALYQYHASLWWGAVLLLAGLLYCVRFAPGRQA
jgi:hypothetical protein